ncbi:MAG: hypothetical protein LBP59_05310 [Planctomycetaceae bacterium]|nr:hypothetical protein [Planctomycetaceae bacterium]
MRRDIWNRHDVSDNFCNKNYLINITIQYAIIFWIEIAFILAPSGRQALA